MEACKFDISLKGNDTSTDVLIVPRQKVKLKYKSHSAKINIQEESYSENPNSFRANKQPEPNQHSYIS